MLQEKMHKYSRIAEDILVDILNNTLLRNGLAVNCENPNDSLALLGDSRRSVIRWGDGESLILLKGDIYFQSYSNSLRARLLEILKNYSDDCPYYLCLPSQFLTCSTDSLHTIKKGTASFYQMHKGTRYIYKRFFKKNTKYLSHFLFKGDSRDQFDHLLNLISSYKAFVVVKSDPLVAETFFKRFLKNDDFNIVTIPGKNAFESYDVILEDIISSISDFDIDTKDILTLISAGPCAKVLAYDLSKKGFTAYDIGKLFECWAEGINCRM